ncbi:uncharacterized protein LOC110875262 [Helianthus annuus]|uniref:uncharacterized protein LOC110875262 n=1 Tax=Helianthus annuus TaxID=4232 RepID=UPI000B8FD3E6|nr:uncharacterized protein LOC110875262 [Helianthus annuus]
MLLGTLKIHHKVYGSPHYNLLSSLSILTANPKREPIKMASTSSLTTTGLSAPAMAIDTLTGANYASWKDSLNLTLALMEFDCALTENAPLALTDKSTEAEKLLYQKWERANHLSLIFMKNSISPAISGAIPDAATTKEYLTNVVAQFQGTSKAQASTLILKLVTTKYDGISGIREHILKMNDMAQKLKGLSMEISDGFLVHFIMTSLPASYEAFKVNYNLQKDQ